MNTANQMRLITDASKHKKDASKIRQKLQKNKELELERLAIMSRSKEIFDPVMQQIKFIAERGDHAFSYFYGTNRDNIWLADAVAQEAAVHGFKVAYKHANSDMGDSSAPCWVTNYWLEITW